MDGWYGYHIDLGWETRRKRIAGHDWAIIKLALPGMIHGFDVDTAFFTGNNTPKVSIQAACLDSPTNLVRRPDMMGKCATPEEIQSAQALGSESWDTILEPSKLGPGYPETRHNLFSSAIKDKRYTHLRVNMFPDGGIARLRVYGRVAVDWSKMPKYINLLDDTLGACAVSCSNAHYGLPKNLLQKGRGVNMADGWETARNPNRPDVFRVGEDGQLVIPGSDYCILKLAHRGIASKVEDDTAHFKGNFLD